MSGNQVEPVQSFDDELNARIVRSSLWVGLGQGGGRLLAFVSTLVLVRILEPEAFGIVAIGMTLLAVISQIQESGLGAALIHGRRHDPKVAASSVLVFASLSGVALTALTVILAPFYTRLLRVPEATEFVQVLAILLALRGLAVAPGAVLERELDFRARTHAELAGAIVQAVVAVACAVAGLGAWSLVASVIAGTAAQTALFWAFAPWRPSPFGASRAMLRDLLRYGRFVSGTNVLIIVNTNIDNAAIARFLGAGPLGVYSVAWRLAEFPVTVIGLIVGRVMFSVYTLLQHDLSAVRAAYVQNMQRTMLVALPVTAAIGVGAEPIVLGLLGPSWSGAIGPLRLLAVFAFLRLLASPSGELFKGIGKPHLTLVTSLVFLAFALPALFVLVPTLDTTGAALAMVVGIAASGSVALYLTFRVLSLHPAKFAHALARPAVCASFVGVAVLATLPATAAVGPVAGLAIVAAAASGSFLVSVALVARPLLTPIRTALRRT